VLSSAGIAQSAGNAGVQPLSALQIKPYRALLVVTSWSDPSALVVNRDKDRFQPVAALLKAWSVPFDILSLERQRLDSPYLFRRDGKVRYGAVIWLADCSSSSCQVQDVTALEQATRAGTGVIAINSRIPDPALLGLKFKELYTSNDPFKLNQQHYLTRDIGSSKHPLPSENRNYSVRRWMQPVGAQVLISQGEHPIVTVSSALNAPAIWLGVTDASELCTSDFWRNIFFRSLIFSFGYMVVPDVDYAHSVIFELDDWGTADKGFLSYWRYLEPSEETIRQYLIAPLQRHHGVASVMVNSGYVDRQSQRIAYPWNKKFTDMYGLHQDYASTRAGLLEGVADGVLNVESHGWTHMEPDLESPPGPWWTADLAGEGSVDGWYSEFQDRLRGKEAPAAAQLFHMNRSMMELEGDFGVRPMELKPGGDAWSRSQFNNTAVLASRVGFGLFHGDTSTYYLDHELVLDMANVVLDGDTGYDLLDVLHPEKWPNHPDGPMILGFHDRDIALDHNFIEQLFAALPTGTRTLAANEYVGIVQTRIDSSTKGDGWQIAFTQTGPSCAWFEKNPSAWRVWLSDALREKLSASRPKISVDGKSVPSSPANFQPDSFVIDLPAGTGTHTWRLETGNTKMH
jgi:hypothetical protein